MHPVDSDEFLRDGVGYLVVVLRGAGDAADHLAGAYPSEELVDALTRETPPVGPHADLHGGMAEVAVVHSTV